MAYVGTIRAGSNSGVVNEGVLAEDQKQNFKLAVKKADTEQPGSETPAVESKAPVKTNGAEVDPKDPAWKKIEAKLEDGKKPNDIWFEAVKNKDVDVVKALIKYKPEGWDVDAVDFSGRTALHWAVLSQDLEMVQTLVEGRIDMAVVDEGGDSAYELAAEYAVDSNGGALQQIADYLKDALSGEAVAAYENGDTKRREALIEAGADDPAPETSSETLSADTKRPAGDTRSAAQIIAANPVLASLSDVDKELLKYGYTAAYAKSTFGITDLKFKGVGDFETDADAAYRAAKVLEHIQNFDEDGNPITGDSVSDGRIDGWTAERTNPRTGKINPNSEAKHGTEAGRFQDFIKYGYESLKGVSEPYKAPEPGQEDDYQALIDELDFRELETTEEVDGRKLTVQELALKEVLSDYKKRIDSGDIKKGSAEWKFFYAMQAKSDLANGRELETHFEQQWAGTDSTTRDLGENKVPASGADMNHLLDSEKVNKAIEEALSDPGVAEDFNKAMVSATTKVPGFNSEQTTEKLRTILSSDGWQKYYEDLKKVDPEKADAQFQQLYGAYSVLAGSEAASGLGADLTRDALADQLEEILRNPDKIPDAEWEAATKDWITLALGYTTTGTFFTQEIANIARDPAFVKLLKDKNFNKGLAEINSRYAALVASGRVTSLDTQVLNNSIKDLANKSFTNLADRNKVTKWFDALNKGGFLSTATGWIAMSSAINRLADGKGMSGDAQENLSIANGFMFWLANGNAQLSFGRTTLKFLQSNLINVGQKVTAGLPIELTNWVKEITTKTPALPANVPNASGYVDKLKGMMMGPEGDKVKLASATGVVRILSSLGYTAFGALAMANGGIGLAKAETPGEKAVAALNFAAGVGFTGAGAAQVASHVAGAKWAGAWISRLGLPAIFLSAVAIIVAEVVGEQKENKFQVDYFKALGELGLLKDGWGDKLEALTLYGYSEDMPQLGEGQSIFDVYDMDQWLADYREINKGNNSTSPKVPGLHYTQSAENSINALVSNYGANIDLEAGTVPALEGSLREQYRSLMTFYLVNVDSNQTAEEAAKWATDQIKDRLGLAYKSSGDTEDALEILDEWLTEQGGMDALTTLAGEVIKEHKLTPDPDEKEEVTRSDRKPNGIDWNSPFAHH